MNNSPKEPSTASLSKRTTHVVRVKKGEWHMKNETTICNISDRNIFLIPISCTSGNDPESQGTINDLKAKMIPANSNITVRSSDYDLNPLGNKSQIYILFRAGDTDDKNKFLEELREKQRAGVKLEEGEMFEIHDGLANRNLDLECSEGPITGGGSAGQDKEEGQGEQSNQNQLNSLSAKLQVLETKVEALQEDLKLLKSLFKSFAEGRTSAA